jgi:[ribosomal protein S5]-alanine N-acetyltransferase
MKFLSDLVGFVPLLLNGAKAAIAYGFNVVKLDKIIAMASSDNFASRRVIEKAGSHYEKQIHIFNLNVLYYWAK